MVNSITRTIRTCVANSVMQWGAFCVHSVSDSQLKWLKVMNNKLDYLTSWISCPSFTILCLEVKDNGHTI